MAATANQYQPGMCLQRVSVQIGAEETGAAQGVGSKEVRLETKRAINSTKKRNKSRRILLHLGF